LYIKVGVDPAENTQSLSARFPWRVAAMLLRRVDRGRDGGDADEIRLQVPKACRDRLIVQVVGHRVNEVNVFVASLAQRAGEVSYPGGRPVAGDLGATGAVVGLYEDDAHGRLSLTVAVCKVYITHPMLTKIDRCQVSFSAARFNHH
jgi:hypothetical protein